MFSSDGTGRIRYILLQSHPACDQTNRTHPRLNNPSILITKSKPLWNRPIVTPIVTSIHSHVHLALVSTPAGGPRSDPCPPGAPRGPRRPLGAPSLVGLQAHRSCTSAKSIHRIASHPLPSTYCVYSVRHLLCCCDWVALDRWATVGWRGFWDLPVR
jgi:hypothetical protein